MKVYRIKHKPSGLFLDIHYSRLTKSGSVMDWKYTIREDIGEPIWHTFNGVKELIWIPFRAWEIKEYDLED